jgi:hypothetical protein
MIEKLLKTFVGEERIAQFKFERRFVSDQRENRPVLFIHQMGKVGSTSIARSLKNVQAGVPWRIYQTHFLSMAGMDFVESRESAAYGGWSEVPRRTKRFLVYSRAISKHLNEGDFYDRSCKVISLVRDPVATNLSGFFHNLHWWPDDLRARCQSGAPGWQQELLDHFLLHYPHDVPEDWFDMEMKSVFGIDVFASDFDKKTGYRRFDSEKFPLLLLRLEDLDKDMAGVIGDFLNMDGLVLQRSNTGQDKWYAEMYAAFKSAVALPASYLDKVYASSYVNHFYAASEIAAFRKRWEEPESIGIVAMEAE